MEEHGKTRVVRARPLLFSPPMVRAILEGRKTQTRRVVVIDESNRFPGFYPDHRSVRVRGGSYVGVGDAGLVWRPFAGSGIMGATAQNIRDWCPYGGVGDMLWVKEGWTGAWHQHDTGNMHLHYMCDGAERFTTAPDGYMLPKAAQRAGRFVTSLFMPRWASRITLELTDVRVQRVQDISHNDAIAEGIVECPIPADDEGPRRIGYMIGPDDGKSGLDVRAQDSYRNLWDSINRERGYGWDKNPLVWALSFRRIA